MELFDINAEIWKPIPGYEGYYECSNIGRVRGLDRLITTHQKHHKTALLKGRVIKASKAGPGYLRVLLCRDNTIKGFYVHRLVAAVFLNAVDGKNEVNHKNRIKTDNRVTNIEWCDRQGNINHSLEKMRRGATHYMTKLSDDDVRDIRKRKGQITGQKLADEYGVNRWTITGIWRNDKRKNVI